MGTLFQSRDRADVRKPTAEEQDDDRRKSATAKPTDEDRREGHLPHSLSS